jgi:N-acetylmuramoyl-L-alanine amidase
VQLTGERDRGVKEGWYKMDQANGPDYFLSATKCPSVIVEGYFLDQLADRGYYAGSPGYYQKLAFAVASGIINYFSKEILK